MCQELKMKLLPALSPSSSITVIVIRADPDSVLTVHTDFVEEMSDCFDARTGV